MILIGIIVYIDSKGPIFHLSERMGVNKVFRMPKFRTMRINTPIVATHLLISPDQYLTRSGKFLRKYSLDEIPQLLSVIYGDMSIVGPRPALLNQYDLIELRKKNGIDKIVPGITGLAQIMGRDNLSINRKISYEKIYLKNMSIYFDLYIIIHTFFVVIHKKNIMH